MPHFWDRIALSSFNTYNEKKTIKLIISVVIDPSSEPYRIDYF
jgi:hypothetical protein